MSVNGSAKENGKGSANLHPVTVKAFAEITGMSERQAKYWRKGCSNPITRVMLEGGHVKPYELVMTANVTWDTAKGAGVAVRGCQKECE